MSSPKFPSQSGNEAFSSYQKFVVLLLAFLQFTIILDFMILAPLGAILLKELQIEPNQFGWVVSAYAFAAGIAGVLAAGFADRFDRKRILIVFYAGFLIGTLFCGFAPNYHLLLAARIFTGLFGGVISSISFAIVADLFPLKVRGRVMGNLQSAFGASQVLGLPTGLFLANHFGWHAPFRMIAGFGTIVGIVIIFKLKPIRGHLETNEKKNPLLHLLRTATNPRYIIGFSAIVLAATGGFMLQPFSSAFTVHNLGVTLDELPVVYMVTGIVSLIAGPLLGRISDHIGKFRMLTIATLLTCSIVWWYTGMGKTPLWLVMLVNGLLFIGISGRMSSISALNSAVPVLQDRGAYMSISSSMQYLAGGSAAAVAGLIVHQTAEGNIENYHYLGMVVIGAMLLTLLMMLRVHRLVHESQANSGI